MKCAFSVALLLATLLTVHAAPTCTPFIVICVSPEKLVLRNGCYVCDPPSAK
ncbi:hypothetical protein K443DRAFT_682105 [Laccaria amethystina LaAM-08-1]|uniref:Uncharacterized protein n=1 Tax=Laccaria amethystina LaAM-08-1 TaxID=1095629 RepID=A0A0C9WVW7_9AGAR|nr:hypothetical protein K443DRAFT_682105 [Laccaria amethystina LaAM-08-1]